jgi:hypothetical protein
MKIPWAGGGASSCLPDIEIPDSETSVGGLKLLD